MVFQKLLAKSSDNTKNPRHEETLRGHALHVMQAASVLPSPQCFFICDNVWQHWTEALYLAAWLHDIGKANDHFQKMLREPGFQQGIRHEGVGLVVVSELLGDWLENFWNRHPAWIKPAILLTIAGHHLKFPDGKERKHSKVTFMGDHPDMHGFLETGRNRFSLPEIPKLPSLTYSLLAFDGIHTTIKSIQRSCDFDFSHVQKVFIASLKSALISCDLAGSALPKHGDVASWLHERLNNSLSKGQIAQIVTQKLGGKPLRDFQKKLAGCSPEESHTVLIEAGCGTGKTVAAYNWADEKARSGRLFFCYPTTSTASEGFTGYMQVSGIRCYSHSFEGRYRLPPS